MGVVFAHLTESYRTVFNAKDAVWDFYYGNFGVDLFFVISGFVMVYASEVAFRTIGSKPEIRVAAAHQNCSALLDSDILHLMGPSKRHRVQPARSNVEKHFCFIFFPAFPLPDGWSASNCWLDVEL